MIIRQMTVQDVNQVYGIALLSLEETYLKEIFLFFMNAWPQGQLVAVSDAGKVIGFLSGARLSSDKATIPIFAIDPLYRGAGIGRRLMEEFRMRTMIDGRRFIELEVRETNTAAASFYKKMGFAAVAFLENFYSSGGNAIRMVCRVSGNS
jgi:ribosomal protein S18 acetylase RimI-like enzyme